jgi:hypothetical protein
VDAAVNKTAVMHIAAIFFNSDLHFFRINKPKEKTGGHYHPPLRISTDFTFFPLSGKSIPTAYLQSVIMTIGFYTPVSCRFPVTILWQHAVSEEGQIMI